MQVASADCRYLSPLMEPVSFVVDQNAEPGDVLPALARLLIGIEQRRRQRQAAEQESAGEADAQAGATEDQG